jgi:hypothetical protein
MADITAILSATHQRRRGRAPSRRGAAQARAGVRISRGFLTGLASELANEAETASNSRRLAGLILKNALDARDEP